MKPKVYIPLSPEAAEHNQRFITKLHYDPKRISRSQDFNSCQLSTAVKGDQAWERFRFKRKRPSVKDDLIGLLYVLFAIGCAGLIAAGFSG